MKNFVVGWICFFPASGQLYAFGDTDSGKLGLGENSHGHNIPQQVHGIPDKVVSVSCGNNHTVAVTGIYRRLSVI